MNETKPLGFGGAPPNVVAIVGYGRSGSTLLASLLGLVPGVLPVGELADVWNASLINELCSCGSPFEECPFWQSVGESAFGGWKSVDVEQLAWVNSEVLTVRRLLNVVNPFAPNREGELRRGYSDALISVYQAIGDVSGASLIVDSTKDPPNFFALRKETRLRLHLVHLVRDSRGVAYSWKKMVDQPQFAGVEGLEGIRLGGARHLRTGPEWLVRNLLVHLIEAQGSPRLFVRYESLISHPVREVQRILEFSGLPTTDVFPVAGLQDAGYESRVFHMVGGNRSRFLRGRVPLQLDNEWMTRMTTRERLLVSAMTLPLLVKYGYIELGLPRIGRDDPSSSNS